MADRPPALPIVDVEPLVEDGSSSARTRAGAEIVRHCREVGFFCAVGHRVDPALLARLEAEARRFFARPETEKARIAMQRGGRGWAGSARAQSEERGSLRRVQLLSPAGRAAAAVGGCRKVSLVAALGGQPPRSSPAQERADDEHTNSHANQHSDDNKSGE